MSAANLNSMPSTILNQSPAELGQSNPESGQIPVPIPETPKQTEPKRDLDSSRFAQIAKKEAALVKEREAFKRELEVFKQQQEETSKYRKAWEMVNEIADLQKVDPVAAMRKAGFSDAELINFVTAADAQQSPEEKAMKLAKAEIEKFRAEQVAAQEELKRQTEELRKVEADKEVIKFKSDIDRHIKSDLDKYEYLNYYGEQGRDQVYEIISAGLKEGEAISVSEAASMVEDYYEEQDKAMNSLKKRAAKMAASKPPEALPQPSEPAKPSSVRVESKEFKDNRAPLKTLSNRVGPSLSSSLPASSLTPEQNKQRVLEKYLSMMKK